MLYRPCSVYYHSITPPCAGRKGARGSLAGSVCGSKLSKQSSVHPMLESLSDPCTLKKMGSASPSLFAPLFHHRWKRNIGAKAQGYTDTYPNSPLSFKPQAVSVAHSLVTKERTVRDPMVSRKEKKSTGTHWFLREEQKEGSEIGGILYFAKGKAQTHSQLPNQQ